MKNLRLKLLLLCVMGIITLGASATPDKNYLCFTANTANSTVELVKNGKAYNVIEQISEAKIIRYCCRFHVTINKGHHVSTCSD